MEPMFDAPTLSVNSKKFGPVVVPLVHSDKPEKVVDFLTSATDAEVMRALYQLTYETVRNSNRQYAALLSYLDSEMLRLNTAVEELVNQNRAASSLQQFPVLNLTPQQALEELTTTLNSGQGTGTTSGVELLEWIFQQRKGSKAQWKDIAQGSSFFFPSSPLPQLTHP